MKYGHRISKLFFTAAWLAIAIAWLAFTARNRAAEGWEWPIRMVFGILLFLLMIVTELLKGRIDETIRTRISDVLILSLTVIVSGYLLAKAVHALMAGNIIATLVFALFGGCFATIFGQMFAAKRRERLALFALVNWCRSCCKTRQEWTGAGEESTLFAECPVQEVNESDVYGERLTKTFLKKLTDDKLRKIPGIGDAEIAVIRRFLTVPELPGIGMETARSIHADGIYTVEQLVNLSEKDLQRYRGIGPARAKTLMRHISGKGSAVS